MKLVSKLSEGELNL